MMTWSVNSPQTPIFLTVFHIYLCDKNVCFPMNLKFKQCGDRENRRWVIPMI
jgi:hypothetical protein